MEINDNPLLWFKEAPIHYWYCRDDYTEDDDVQVEEEEEVSKGENYGKTEDNRNGLHHLQDGSSEEIEEQIEEHSEDLQRWIWKLLAHVIHIFSIKMKGKRRFSSLW